MQRRYTAIVDGKETAFDLEKTGEGAARLSIEGRELNLDIAAVGEGRYSILDNGRSYAVDVVRKSDKFQVGYRGKTLSFSLADERQRRKAGGADATDTATGGDVVSPMPGKVVRVNVEAGQRIKAGEGLVVVEAMKMENEFKSPKDGVVQAIKVKVGDSVDSGTVLVIIG